MPITTPTGRPTSLDPASMRRMAAAAATLDERLETVAARPTAPRAPTPRARRRLRRWRRLVDPDDAGHFARRLAWDGLTEADALRALDVDIHDGDGPLPEWLTLVADAVQQGENVLGELEAGRVPPWSGMSGTAEPPYLEVWLPFARVCRRRLEDRVDDTEGLLTERAHRQMEALLLRDLARQGAMAMDARFRERLPEEPAFEADADGHYRRFVADMLVGGLAELMQELPVLARSLARVASSWVESTAELVERLIRDRDEIAHTLGTGPGPVVAIEPGLSDRHRGGRRTAILEFEGGRRVVYKPRPVGVDAAFAELLRWLEDQGLEPAPPRLRVVGREGYGWIEEAVGGRLEAPAEAERYFRAAGALVCLAWLLRARDLHVENVVATDRGPVIVDLEMFLQPETDDESGGDRTAAGAPDVATSCLGSGLVGFLQSDDSGEVRDQGGLSGTGTALSSTPRRRWRHLRSDAIRAEEEHEVRFETRNRPTLDGEPQSPADWAASVRAGFRATYELVRERRRALLAEDGPLAAFRDEPVRLLFRPSGQYGALLHVLATPGYQGSGAIRSCALDSLNRVFADATERPLLWDLVSLERSALEGLDIPLFQVPSHGTLVNDSCELPGYLLRSGLAAVRRRLESLDVDDRKEQIELLDWALERDPALRFEAAGAVPDRASAEDGDSHVAVVEALAERLVSRAERDAAGAWSWPSPSLLGRHPAGAVSELALYAGSSGVAVLLAALGRCRGGDWWQLAREVIDPVARGLGSGAARKWARGPGGLGAGTGIGSLLHALTLLAHLGDEPELLQPALAACRDLPLESLPREPGGDDVLGGRAGLLLGLLSLHGATHEDRLLSAAGELGAQLRDTAEPTESGGLAWPDHRGLYPGGFAHGTAGIACALVRLAAASGDERWLDLARAAYRHETELYEPRRGNWRIPRPRGITPDASVVWMVGWCQGAPGSALARVLTHPWLDDPERSREAASGLRTTGRRGRVGSDHLCCGNLGRSDVLLTAGRFLDSDELVAAGRELAHEVVDAARRRGHFALAPSHFAARTFHHGFFQGLSGIGYQLLRTERPELLPSVLAFEPPTPPPTGMS